MANATDFQHLLGYELAIFCVFGVANGQLTSERFFLDRATQFTQLDVSLEASRANAA